MAYESLKLTVAVRNYPAHALELLAVVHALRAYRLYLLGGGGLDQRAAGLILTCGRTTRRSRGSRRTDI